jgi:hypothetical protein
LTGGLTIYDLWRKTRRSPVPAAQKGPFITAQPQGMSGQILRGAELGEARPLGEGPAMKTQARQEEAR